MCNALWVISMSPRTNSREKRVINEYLFYFLSQQASLCTECVSVCVCVCVCVGAHMYVSVCGQHWILYVWSKALDGPLILFPTISVRRRKGGDEEDRLVAQ